MARNEAAKVRQGLNPKNGKATKSAREVGAYGRSRPRADASVRRAREVANSPRLKAAAEEQRKAEEKLAALQAELDGQEHTPYQAQVAEFVARTTEECGVPLKVEDPATLAKVAVLLKAGPSKNAGPSKKKEQPVREPGQRPEDVRFARELLRQGYHVARVVERTSVPFDYLKKFVGPDGYLK